MKPRPLKTAAEALAALKRGAEGGDLLGTVYYSAKGVTVATASGAGTFTLKEWKDAGGCGNSQEGAR